MHDGTVRYRTIRISQRERQYVLFVRRLVRSMGAGAWTYREGKARRVYVVEFSRSLMEGFVVRTREEIIDYARGYFDAEGGLPRTMSHGAYLYFAQKDRRDLGNLKKMLVSLGISCGRIHNPSKRIDPDYWRFYVRRGSIRTFARIVGSWQPRKAILLSRLAHRAME